jgi:hypothetical protein
VEDEDGSELFLITDNEDTEFITDVISASGVTATNVFEYDSQQEIIDKLEDEEILIMLTDDMTLINHIALDIPISLETNDVTGCQPILISNNIIDNSKVQLKYYTTLQFWTDQIKKYQNA